jgi:hypothetical protein
MKIVNPMRLVLTLLFLSFRAVWAQGEETVLHIPAGGILKATLAGKTTEVQVRGEPEIVAIEFGRKENGRLVPYKEEYPMSYEDPFYVWLRYGSEPEFNETPFTLKWENGTREVILYKSNSDPALFQSKELNFEDPTVCKGLVFCLENRR